MLFYTRLAARSLYASFGFHEFGTKQQALKGKRMSTSMRSTWRCSYNPQLAKRSVGNILTGVERCRLFHHSEIRLMATHCLYARS